MLNTQASPTATLLATAAHPTSPETAPNLSLTPPDSRVGPAASSSATGSALLANWIATAQQAEDQRQQEQQRRQAAERLRPQPPEPARARFAVD